MPSFDADQVYKRVMLFIEEFTVRDVSPDEFVAKRLVEKGVPPVDAELIEILVPSGLSFALLEHMGLRQIPEGYSVRDGGGEWVLIRFRPNDYFAAALALGREVMRTGYSPPLDKSTFQTITLRSSEMNAVSAFLDSGGTLDELHDVTLSPPTLLGVTYEELADAHLP